MNLSELHSLGELKPIRKDVWVFYGNDRCTETHLSQYNPYYLKQIHSSKVIMAQKAILAADGHWTSGAGQTLVIRTADCLPVFFLADENIVALHIGWRGLKKKILTTSFKALKGTQKLSSLYVGPHIQFASFQLDAKNTLELLQAHRLNIKSAQNNGMIEVSRHQVHHYNINLSSLLRYEAKILGFKSFQISDTDTFLSPRHHSYRRQRLTQARNLSFTVKL